MVGNRNRKVYKLHKTVATKIEQPTIVAEAPKPRSNRWLVALTILLCIVGVLAISRFFLIDNSIRLDESQSLWQTSHSVKGTLKVVAQDVHVPMYHLILHFWQFYLGQSIETARYLSLLFFIATIPVIYLIARRVLSQNWALIAVIFFSFSPFMNWYANEARMYTLLVFMASLSQYFFLRILENKKGKGGWLGYALTAMVGVYSHYFFAFNLLAQAVFYLIARKNFPKGSFKKFVAVGVAVIAALSPWAYYFVSLGSASNTTPDLTRPSTIDFFNAFSNFSFGFQTDAVNTILVSMWPLLVIVSLLAVKKGQSVNVKLAYIASAAFLPILIAFGLSFVATPFFVSRYMVSCVAPLIILILWFVSHYNRALARAAVLGLAAVVIATSVQQYVSTATPVKEDYRAAAQTVGQDANADDIVVLSAPFTVYPFDYYYDGQAKVITLPNWNRTIPGPVPPFVRSELPAQVKGSVEQGHIFAYVLLSYDQGYEEEVFQYFEQNYTRVQSKRFSNDLVLYVYQVGYNKVKPVNELPPDPGITPVPRQAIFTN